MGYRDYVRTRDAMRELAAAAEAEHAPWWTGNTAEDLAGAMLDAAKAEAENAFAPTGDTLAACRAVLALADEFPAELRDEVTP